MCNKAEHLIKRTFNEWNSYKRALTLAEIEFEKGNFQLSEKYQLKSMKLLLQVELSLRALQTEIRSHATDGDLESGVE